VTPEGALQSCILDWLAAKRVLAFRQNTGAVKTEKRFFRFGVPGMADILAFHNRIICTCPEHEECDVFIQPVWIEVKAPKGKQSELQKSFQQQVEAEGHRYILARSVEDVEEALQ
jgi:hypothetical protein